MSTIKTRLRYGIILSLLCLGVALAEMGPEDCTDNDCYIERAAR